MIEITLTCNPARASLRVFIFPAVFAAAIFSTPFLLLTDLAIFFFFLFFELQVSEIELLLVVESRDSDQRDSPTALVEFGPNPNLSGANLKIPAIFQIPDNIRCSRPL